jgi:hypothetical protein
VDQRAQRINEKAGGLEGNLSTKDLNNFVAKGAKKLTGTYAKVGAAPKPKAVVASNDDMEDDSEDAPAVAPAPQVKKSLEQMDAELKALGH